MAEPQINPADIVLPDIDKCQTAVGQKNGYVVLGIFEEGKDVRWVPLEPTTALEVGESMAKNSYELQYGSTPPASALKASVLEKKRQVLIIRCGNIIRQLGERGKKPEYIAESVVDACLNELA